MADAEGIYYADAFTSENRGSPAHGGGRVYVISDKYEAVALAQASTVILGNAQLPKNARIVHAELRCDATGTGNTWRLYDGDPDATAYTANTVVGPTLATSENRETMEVDYLGTVVPENAFAHLQLGGSNPATGTVDVTIFYTIA